ncbi:MAG: T9SS type A sorting domain-containing protein [Rhodothermales bacterium]
MRKRYRRSTRSAVVSCLLAAVLAIPAAAQDYEIRNDSVSASGWFGGDDRDCCGPRHVGTAQSVLIEENITVNSFAFSFSREFDYSANPDGHGHAVTLVLNVFDESGNPLGRSEVALPDTFAGGWVTWDSLGVNAAANATLIFSTYMVGALTDSLAYTTGYHGDQYGLYEGGVGYAKHGSSDADMELWSGWSQHTWDRVFVLKGTVRISQTGIEDAVRGRTELVQNYPNPFQQSTVVPFELEASGRVSLAVFDLLGRRVGTLADEVLGAGRHQRTADLDGLPAGQYFVRLESAGEVSTRMITKL